MRFLLLRRFRSAVLLLACSILVQATVPRGWYLAGSKPGEYECNPESDKLYNKLPTTYLRSREGVQTTGFGTLMQSFSAGQYAGKQVRFSANVKADNVVSWAGLWMRVDAASKKTVAFDNMQSRPIKGTANWMSYSVVLDVPAEATGIALGILLEGSGAVWLNGGKFEVVGPAVATTGESPRSPVLPDAPVNLDFETR